MESRRKFMESMTSGMQSFMTYRMQSFVSLGKVKVLC